MQKTGISFRAIRCEIEEKGREEGSMISGTLGRIHEMPVSPLLKIQIDPGLVEAVQQVSEGSEPKAAFPRSVKTVRI